MIYYLWDFLLLPVFAIVVRCSYSVLNKIYSMAGPYMPNEQCTY